MYNFFPKRFLSALIFACLPYAFVYTQSKAKSGSELVAKLACPDRVHDVVYSPDGSLIAAGYGWNVQGGIRIWKASDHSIIANLLVGKDDNAVVERVSFSNNGKLFAATNWRGDVVVWNVGAWHSQRIILSGYDSPKSLGFSPDSTKVAFASEKKAIVYDLKNSKVFTLSTGTDSDSFINIAFTPDGKSILVFRDSSVQLFDSESRHLIKSWKNFGGGFFGKLSTDGGYAVSGGGSIIGEKYVKVWNINSGQTSGELSDFRSGLFASAISHSGKLLALSGGDYGSGGDLSIWSFPETKEIGFLSFGEFPIQALDFSPDDKTLAAGSEDGFVLLYDVNRIKGPQSKKQDYSLCGQVAEDEGKYFLFPLSKVPRPMRTDFEYDWRLEIANPDIITGSNGSPIALTDWYLEEKAADSQARINKLERLGDGSTPNDSNSDYIVFGDVQNPGWNQGFLLKIYRDGRFMATKNSGECLADGALSQFNTDFETIKNRLIVEGFLTLPKDPLTLGTDHYRTRFIEIALNGVQDLRTDAENIELLLKGGPAKKREAFSAFYTKEEPFILSLLKKHDEKLKKHDENPSSAVEVK